MRGGGRGIDKNYSLKMAWLLMESVKGRGQEGAKIREEVAAMVQTRSGGDSGLRAIKVRISGPIWVIIRK